LDDSEVSHEEAILKKESFLFINMQANTENLINLAVLDSSTTSASPWLARDNDVDVEVIEMVNRVHSELPGRQQEHKCEISGISSCHPVTKGDGSYKSCDTTVEESLTSSSCDTSLDRSQTNHCSSSSYKNSGNIVIVNTLDSILNVTDEDEDDDVEEEDSEKVQGNEQGDHEDDKIHSFLFYDDEPMNLSDTHPEFAPLSTCPSDPCKSSSISCQEHKSTSGKAVYNSNSSMEEIVFDCCVGSLMETFCFQGKKSDSKPFYMYLDLLGSCNAGNEMKTAKHAFERIFCQPSTFNEPLQPKPPCRRTLQRNSTLRNILRFRSLPNERLESISDDGYDSDPGFPSTPRSQSPRTVVIDDNMDDLLLIQHCLNAPGWIMTLHKDSKTSISTKVWLERGRLMKKAGRSVMVEPKLAWMEEGKVRSTGLLNIVRVRATDMIDRRKHPLALTACSLWVKTNENTEYLFQAESEAVRNAIVRQWKLVIARFATLAVLGEADRILAEFFVTNATTPAPF
jgi:hypothetical protein